MATFTYILDGREVSATVWQKARAAKVKRLNLGRKPASIDRNRDCNRRVGPVGPSFHSVMDAHDERYRKWYKEPPPPVIEDYRSEEAKKSWPRYRRIQMPDGTWKEGPLRFQSYEEQNTYERTFNFRQTSGREGRQRI